jgi:DNA-binding transcriptional LysR family regulator
MIDRLEMFVALARERHFGRAAAACGVTQPTLSSAIRGLEDQLGVQLVWRGSRFQGLTPEGERVLDWARRITGDVRALRDEMRARRSGLAGALTLGVIPTALPWIARLTAPFAARHGEVLVRIVSASSAEILAGLDDHAFDAGVTYLDNEPLGRVDVAPLYAERYRLLLAGEAPERVGWADLGRWPLCLLTEEMQNRRLINQHLAAAGVKVRPGVESNSVLALIAHVRTGRWASVVPEALAETVAGPGLASVLIDTPEAAHRVGLVVPQRGTHTPIVAALLDTARRVSEPGRREGR